MDMYAIYKKDDQYDALYADDMAAQTRLVSDGYSLVCEIEAIDKDVAIRLAKDQAQLDKADQRSTSGTSVATSQSNATHYATARITTAIIQFVGWATLVIGIVVLLASFGEATRYGRFVIVALLPGLGICMSGLLIVSVTQIANAIIDTATDTREIRNALLIALADPGTR